MVKKNHRRLAKVLVLKGILIHKQKFIREEDLLNGVDKQAVLDQVDDIYKSINLDEIDRLRLKVRELEMENDALRLRINTLASLEDCDEEFEM